MEKLERKIYVVTWYNGDAHHQIFYTIKEANEFANSLKDYVAYVAVRKETVYFDIPKCAVSAIQERANDLSEDVKRIEKERDELLDFLGGRIQKTEPEHKEESLPW